MKETVIILMIDLDNKVGMRNRIEKAYNRVLSYIGAKNSNNELGHMPDYPMIHYNSILTEEEKSQIVDILEGDAFPLFIQGNHNKIEEQNNIITIKL